ncbi:MAG: BON domain-containing protein [Alphaproteobacteria bacterium]|nr:BON domain-containing protein [Alphaproteobacteria bacterium]
MSATDRRWSVAALAAALLLLTGCPGAIVGAGATGGIAVMQERTVGSTIDDTGVKLSVKDRLLEKSDRLFVAVGVDVVEGRVLLTGNVPKPEDRIEAARITWQVNGVREVYNELEVRDRSSVGNYLRDVRISNELRFKMLADRNVSAINYNVETVNAVVYLTGIAQNQGELERVTGHARSIAGVQRVVSYVLLKDDQRRS